MLRFPQHDKRLKARKIPATAIEAVSAEIWGLSSGDTCGERSSTAKPIDPRHTALTRWVSGRRLATICIFY